MSTTDTGRPEPVLIGQIGTAITAVLGLLFAFGLPISDKQQAAVLGTVAALLPLAAVLGAMWSRGKVTPLADPRDAAGRALVPLHRARPGREP